MTIKKIVVVGGGSAGWLSAAIIAAQHNALGVEVTLVESSDIPTIGVGEGTWPTMRTTLKNIGINEAEFIDQCSASFKQGSKFVGWRTGEADDYYYHPFTAPAGFESSNVYGAWQKRFAELSFGDAVAIQGVACEAQLAPKQLTTPEYAGVLNYGYHLDAGKFAQLLKSHCVEKLNVRHIVDTVTAVNSIESGDISSITTSTNGDIEGDLFIDCSGTHGLLLDKHFNIPYVDLSQYSPNDRALAVQIPYGQEGEAIASATVATAQSAGWTWDIGLSSRRGVGYVYASDYIEADDAERELRDYIGKTTEGVKTDDLMIKSIPIMPGHRKKFWHRNCVAIGMSAGFIEPLEASALALIELSANMIRDELPMTRDGMRTVENRFNEVFLYRWRRIVEFLRLHYVLSSRSDSEYWRQCKQQSNMPEGLRELLDLWRSRPPNHYDLMHTEELFPSASYMYVLYGMGFKTQLLHSDQLQPAEALAVENIQKVRAASNKYLTHLPNNRDLINHVIKQVGKR